MHQGTNTIVIDAPPEAVWAVLEDSSRVPEYMRAVKQIDKRPGSREHVGARRTCQVELEGRTGEVVELCTELVHARRLTHVVERDAFGFNRLFEGFGFTFELTPQPDARTLVRLEGFYRERGLRGRLLNRLVMRRKLHALRDRILAELQRVVEASPSVERHADRVADEAHEGRCAAADVLPLGEEAGRDGGLLRQ